MSRSLRVSNELFESATTAGALSTRSAAQQVEHWARLGRELEELGLSAMEASLLAAGRLEFEDAETMIRDKRARQSRDLEDLRAGRRSQASMLLFTPEEAKRTRVLNGPY